MFTECSQYHARLNIEAGVTGVCQRSCNIHVPCSTSSYSTMFSEMAVFLSRPGMATRLLTTFFAKPAPHIHLTSQHIPLRHHLPKSRQDKAGQVHVVENSVRCTPPVTTCFRSAETKPIRFDPPYGPVPVSTTWIPLRSCSARPHPGSLPLCLLPLGVLPLGVCLLLVAGLWVATL